MRLVGRGVGGGGDEGVGAEPGVGAAAVVVDLLRLQRRSGAVRDLRAGEHAGVVVAVGDGAAISRGRCDVAHLVVAVADGPAASSVDRRDDAVLLVEGVRDRSGRGPLCELVAVGVVGAGDGGGAVGERRRQEPVVVVVGVAGGVPATVGL